MRTLHAALAAGRSAIELSRIIAWTRTVATVFATTASVLGASFVAVALNLA
jgi:hypothetical protein